MIVVQRVIPYTSLCYFATLTSKTRKKRVFVDHQIILSPNLSFCEFQSFRNYLELKIAHCHHKGNIVTYLRVLYNH